MKRVFCVLLAAVITALVLQGCKKKNEPVKNPDGSYTIPGKTIYICDPPPLYIAGQIRQIYNLKLLKKYFESVDVLKFEKDNVRYTTGKPRVIGYIDTFPALAPLGYPFRIKFISMEIGDVAGCKFNKVNKKIRNARVRKAEAMVEFYRNKLSKRGFSDFDLRDCNNNRDKIIAGYTEAIKEKKRCNLNSFLSINDVIIGDYPNKKEKIRNELRLDIEKDK